MTNHPNRAPQHDETFAELIARRPERLNILVTARQSAPGCDSANVVHLRYGYTPLREPIDHRAVRFGVTMPERWDDTAPDQLGRPGAYVSVPDAASIRAAIAALRAAWGPLHVQDNSGAVPDLDQGKWRG